MRFTSILSTLALAAPAFADIGHSVINNNCPFDATVQMAGPKGWEGPVYHIPPGQQFAPQYMPGIAGYSIRVYRGIGKNGPHEQFEYHLDRDGSVWYDLSFVNGNPFGTILMVPDADCGFGKPRSWAVIDSADEVYWVYKDNHAVKRCHSNVNIVRHLCG